MRRAQELFLLNRLFTAQQELDFGLVSRLVPSDAEPGSRAPDTCRFGLAVAFNMAGAIGQTVSIGQTVLQGIILACEAGVVVASASAFGNSD